MSVFVFVVKQNADVFAWTSTQGPVSGLLFGVYRNGELCSIYIVFMKCCSVKLLAGPLQVMILS